MARKKNRKPAAPIEGDPGYEKTRDVLLMGLLEIAVPMWVERLRRQPWN